MERLKGKVALVTGAGSGIGRAIAECFAAEGAKVVAADINDAAKEVATSIGAIFVRVDVAEASSVAAMIEAVVAQCGRLDILVNNAGIAGERAPIEQSTVGNWRRVLSVNLDGVYYGLRFGLPVLSEGGVVLNMSSVAGLVGLENVAAYSASKGAIVQLTRSAALECARRRIRVNALCPTAVLTPLLATFRESSQDAQARNRETVNPLPGAILPEDVARAALFLVSDEAKFITGVALPLDAGYTAR